MAEDVEDWDSVASWWIDEVAADHVHSGDIRSILEILLDPPSMRGTSDVVLELGCGEGQWLRWLAGDAAAAEGSALGLAGCDLSADLLQRAAGVAPVVRCRLPDLRWLRDASVHVAFAVYVLDLIEDLDAFFAETARVVAPGGTLAVIVNHPVFTAPGSFPINDEDGEAYFRWGDYFGTGSSTEPAADRAVRFHHRSMARLLTAAAEAGWALERLEERGLSEAVVAAEPAYAGQTQFPRILGARWRREETVLADI